MVRNPQGRGKVEPEELKEQVEHILEECRMILPGVQALFGFQLIAVFNKEFSEKLSGTEQAAHLVALCLVALSAGCVLTPAAYHRIAEPAQRSEGLVRVASRFLAGAMVPLMFGVCIDLYLIGRIITHSSSTAGWIGASALVLFACLWFVLPAIARMRNLNEFREKKPTAEAE